MPAYDVAVTVTSSPTDAGIKIGGLRIYLDRDDDGNWAGSRKNLKFTGDTDIDFRARGISGTDWKLTISFTPTSQKPAVPYSHEDTIPNDAELSIFHDTVKL